ncbi:unnamed protein product [Urochloa decumbens]|uniref:Uncharacterized protein n=2 Tax=Urochloa decumbens TaxID=240449 RepID=A0ABC9GY41_9POAL
MSMCISNRRPPPRARVVLLRVSPIDSAMSHRRQFLNLVTMNWANGVSSLRRLDLHSRHNNLFYPTPAAAEEAAAQDDPSAPFSNDAFGRRRQVSLKKVPRLHLPPAPAQSFQHCHDKPCGGRRMACVALSESQTAFFLEVAYGGSRRRAFLYDSGERRVVTLPDLQSGIYHPICLPVTGGEHGDAAVYIMETLLGRDTEDEEKKTRILFQALVHRKYFMETFCQDDWRCDELPPPPYITSISCHALVGGGTDVICVSTAGVGTYCFDTANRTWSKAGDWALPFFGKIEHDRDLGIWVGFLSSQRDDAYRLCATTDLFSDTERGRLMEYSDEFWLCRRDDCKDLEPPYGWYGESLPQLVGLGSGKFCLVQFFETREEACTSCQHEEVEDRFAVFTGVEVVRCGVGSSKDGDGSDKDERIGALRIVLHKSKRYMLTNFNGTIEFVL